MDINNNRAGKRGRWVGGVATTTAVASKRHKNELQQNCAKTPINLSKVEAQKRNENSKGKALKENWEEEVGGGPATSSAKRTDARVVVYCGVYITLSVFILTVRCEAGEAWQLASVSHAQGQQVGVSPLFHLARTLPGKSYELRLYQCVCGCVCVP